jgi:hypothetical protein
MNDKPFYASINLKSEGLIQVARCNREIKNPVYPVILSEKNFNVPFGAPKRSVTNLQFDLRHIDFLVFID